MRQLPLKGSSASLKLELPQKLPFRPKIQRKLYLHLEFNNTPPVRHLQEFSSPFFSPCGLSTQVKATYVDQEGKFGDPFSGFISDDDQFWVVDAAISYRLPKRWGFITLEIKNLFDEEFNFQDTDPANPWTVPEQVIIGKCTLNF